MSFKSAVVIEVQRGENVYHFYAPAGVSLQECYEVSIDITNKIVDFAKKAEERQKDALAKPEAADNVAEKEQEDESAATQN